MRTLVLALALALAAPLANASDAVSVTFVANSDPAGLYGESRCALTVPDGARGVDVLDAAVDAGCIDSYSLTWYGADAFVECVDDAYCTYCPPPYLALCGYWAFYVNGEYATTSVSAYRAVAGDEFRLTYDLWPASLLP